jgi:hypothetical protein
MVLYGGKTVVAASLAVVAIAFVWTTNAARRRRRAAYVEKEKKQDVAQQETLLSILENFQELKLAYGCTADEANKKRTTRYYQLARDAHVYDLVLGVRSYPRLRNRREIEMARIMKYWNLGNAGDTKSHRTVIAMCDSVTSKLLCQARDEILEPLNYSTDIMTTGVWIPERSITPETDMHVTVAIPWWWHTVRDGNRELSEELVARFRQALVLEFHHPFQIELDRIVLLGGKTLVALWRCVGTRTTDDGLVIHDRHGDSPDPFVKLRRDIVRCFTSTDSFESIGKEPLTYNHRFQKGQESSTDATQPPMPARGSLVRQNSIAWRTPGLSSHDGFIHNTLARLPLDCLSMTDVELAPIHRLCREATATYCGHRLVVSEFRFLETTGAGGDSNPCVDPIFDEIIPAPPRIEVDMDGGISENTAFIKTVDRHVTIGAGPRSRTLGLLEDLFTETASDDSLGSHE